MPANYDIPSNASLMMIDPVYMGEAIAGDPIFDYFPIEEVDSDFVMWEQLQSVSGLQQARNLNSDLPRVQNRTLSRFSLRPGRYGEYMEVTEEEIVAIRTYGTFNQPIDLSKLVAVKQELMTAREGDRMRWLLWQLLQNGFYTVLDQNNTIMDQASYTLTTVAAGTSWSNKSASTPLADFRAVTLKHRGQSAVFDNSAKAFMSLATFNNLIANSNANDLGGRRAQGLETIEGLKTLNELMLKDNLPNIVIYDKFYLDETTQLPVQFLADNTVVVIGRRTNNAKIGSLKMTRNGSLSGRPGVFVGTWTAEKPPFHVEVFRNWNGGVSLAYPGAIVIMNV